MSPIFSNIIFMLEYFTSTFINTSTILEVNKQSILENTYGEFLESFHYRLLPTLGQGQNYVLSTYASPFFVNCLKLYLLQ